LCLGAYGGLFFYVMFRGSKTAMKITTKAPNNADFRRAPWPWSKGRDEVVSVPLLSTMKK
jgi:hypothetical protein